MRIGMIGLYLPDVDSSSQYEECFVLYIYIYTAKASQIQLMQLQDRKLQI